MKHFNEDIDEVEIPYAHLDSMNYQAKRVISTAAHALFPGASVSLVGDIDTDSLLLSPKAIAEYPRAEWFVEAQMRRMFDLLPEFPDTYLFLDIETHNAEKRWDMPLESFFRLGQYAWGEGPIQTTTDLDEVLALIEQAERVIAHNGHSFDFSVLLGNEALDLAFEGKLFDTYTYAKLKFPCPVTYTHANGTTYRSNTSPAQYRRWYGLDNLAYQFGSARKFGDLAALVAKYNPPKTPRSELDFGLVPLDDPDFVVYAVQDIEALRELTRSMVTVGGLDDYDYRCQVTDAIDAKMSRNGILVDTDLAQARVEEAEAIKAEVLTQLERDYNFPTKGKMPWRTKAGKEAIERLLRDVGIDIYSTDWPKTSTGNPSLSGTALVEGTSGTPAESLGESLAILQGQRPLAAQALQYTSADGVMHPDIDALQRSGRRCLPETHKILTRRGILHIDDVVIGDETLDLRNRWVPITEIHRYEDAVVHRYENRSVFLESTPEHRWVQWTNGRGTRTIEPLNLDLRRTLQLTPDAYPFDRSEHHFPQDMTERERFAAIVGLLITDGTAKLRVDSPNSGAFRIYQTEGKFYDLFMELIPPEWITSDYKRSPKKHMVKSGYWITGRSPIHEIRLKASVIMPMLENEGLDVTLEGLRYSPTLMTWLLTLSQHETLAFLTAVYLADGAQCKSGSTEIATLNENAVDVFQVAAYRCGKRSNYRVYEGKVVPLNGRVALLNDKVSVRNLTQKGTVFTEYTAPVWCVTTTTGTFTAWNPDGRFSGPYLTGNSVSKAGLTTWGSRSEAGMREKEYFIARPDRILVESDLSNSDARAVAFMSQDKNRAKWFEPGADSHEIVGRLMFGDEVYDSDPKKYRNISKPLNHGAAFGAGAKKLSAQAKVPLKDAERFLEVLQEYYPDVVRWQNKVREEGLSGWLTNYWGRTMPVEIDRTHTQAPALMGQSSTTEVLYDGLIKLYYMDREYLNYILFPVHDALLCEPPEDRVEEFTKALESSMYQVIEGIEFMVESGTPGRTWKDAQH